MAEYIDRALALREVKRWENGITVNIKAELKALPPSDVIERSEYEYLKKENRELAIKYDNAMNMVINEQENVTRLRSKINKAIEEIEDLDPITERVGLQVKQEILNILKRNIGE